MTNTGGTPAGWHYAPGDPEGTHRYWDGAQWIGEPQAVEQQAPAPDPAPAPPPGYQQDAPAFGAVPQGYQNVSAPGMNVGTPAEWGTRAVALLIDWGIGIGIYIVGFILAAIAGTIADVLGLLMFLLTYAAAIAYFVWNMCIKQGSTGQSIGKEKQGIKLVKDETGQPVGGGMAFVRYLLAGLISSFTCGIYGLLDYLWPLWDPEKKRLTDKIVKMSVVIA